MSKGGDLHRELKNRGKFEEEDAAILMKQVLICVNYCHKNNVVHRDLKPGNILLEGHKKLEHIKVIDFGEAVIASPTEKLTEITGTMSYVSFYRYTQGKPGLLGARFRLIQNHSIAL